MLDVTKPQLVSVTGLIGVGKTTLAEKLADRLNATLITEQFAENPYLAEVYEGQRDVALDSEIFFLSSSASQLTEGKIQPGKLYVNDYIFDKAIVYAGQWLNDDQMGEYMRFYEVVCEKVVPPVLVIFIEDSIENCLDRIKQRNREFELDINAAFLQQQLNGYNRIFENWTASPILKIPADQCFTDADVDRLAKEVEFYISKHCCPR